MRYLLLVGLLLVGCGKGEEKKTWYKPSELIALKELPSEEIVIRGKIAHADISKQETRPGKVMIVLEDRGISTKEHKNYVNVVFESEGKEFSDSFVKWFNGIYDEQSVAVKGKLLKGDAGRIFMYDAELQ